VSIRVIAVVTLQLAMSAGELYTITWDISIARPAPVARAARRRDEEHQRARDERIRLPEVPVHPTLVCAPLVTAII